MNNARITQENFNRICEKLRNANMLGSDTDMHSWIVSGFPEFHGEEYQELLELLLRLFTSTQALKKPEELLPDRLSVFMSCFQKLWSLVIPQALNRREEYLQALQPYAEKGLLKEVFWSDDFSVIELKNHMLGLFDYQLKTSRFRGILLDSASILMLVREYTGRTDLYARIRALDEARMTICIFDPYEKARIQGNYTTPGNTVNTVMKALGEEEFLFPVTIRIRELADSDIYNKKTLNRIIQQYGRNDFETFLKTVIFFSMNAEQQKMFNIYYAVKKLFDDSEVGKLLILRDHIWMSSPRGYQREIRTEMDLRLVKAPETNIGDLLAEKNQKFHKEEMEEAERIRLREEKAARIEAWWAAHPEEKAALDREESDCRAEIARLSDQLKPYYREMRTIGNLSTEELSSGLKQLAAEIAEKSQSIYAISFFNKKKRKAVQEEVDQLKAKRRAMETELKNAEASLEETKDRKKQELTAAYRTILDRREELEQRLSAIAAEKAKYRETDKMS